MKTIEVRFRYRFRNEGKHGNRPSKWTRRASGAIAKAARELVKGLDRKQRFRLSNKSDSNRRKSIATATERSHPLKPTAG